jgi:hypothetical protein
MPTHFPNGVTNVTKESMFGDLKEFAPNKYTTFWADFVTPADLGAPAVNAANVSCNMWDITKVDSGGDNASIVSCTDGQGGLLTITTDNAENDGVALQSKVEPFNIDESKETFFETRIKAGDPTQTDWLCGLAIKDTTPFAGLSDSITFKCDDGSTAIRLVSETNMSGSIVSASVTAVASMSDDTFVKLGYHFDGFSNIKVFTDDVHVATLSVVSGTNLVTDEDMAPIVAVLTGEAAANTIVVDYIAALQEK